jgi:hypothetical protein
LAPAQKIEIVLYDQHFIDDLKERADLVRRAILSLCVVVGLALVSFGQEVPPARLVDEFPLLITCGDLVARTDSLAADIQRNPHSSALIFIADDSSLSTRAHRTKRIIDSTLQLRGIELERFRIFSVDDNPSVNFWLAPPGSENPIKNGIEFERDAVDTSEPFIFGFTDELGICPTFVPKAFAKLLIDNPGSRGHVVVRTGDDPSVNKFAFAKEWINELVEKQGIPRSRLRLALRPILHR